MPQIHTAIYVHNMNQNLLTFQWNIPIPYQASNCLYNTYASPPRSFISLNPAILSEYSIKMLTFLSFLFLPLLTLAPPFSHHCSCYYHKLTFFHTKPHSKLCFHQFSCVQLHLYLLIPVSPNLQVNR